MKHSSSSVDGNRVGFVAGLAGLERGEVDGAPQSKMKRDQTTDSAGRAVGPRLCTQ